MVSLSEIESHIDRYKICHNCQSLNKVENKKCVECDSDKDFADLTKGYIVLMKQKIGNISGLEV